MSAKVGSNLVQNHDADYYYGVYLLHISQYLCSTGQASHPLAIAEVGPGKSLAAGLTGLLLGANELYCLDLIDHSEVLLNIDYLYQIASLLKKRTPPLNLRHWPNFAHCKGLDEDFPEYFKADYIESLVTPERVASIEAALRHGHSKLIKITKIFPWQEQDLRSLYGRIDFIYSHSVMEHVDDLPNAYKRMHDLLRVGGGMSHSIDLKSHGFSRLFNGHLAFSDLEWEEIVQDSPYTINRQSALTHQRLLADLGFLSVMQLRRSYPNGIKREDLRCHSVSDYIDDFKCGNFFTQVVKMPDSD